MYLMIFSSNLIHNRGEHTNFITLLFAMTSFDYIAILTLKTQNVKSLLFL